ncbi:MAG: GxxExxY protein [Bacteroidota bacterium]
MDWTRSSLNQLGYDVIAAAIEVHNFLGPGLLESVYEECLVEELKLRDFMVERQVKVPLAYKGRKVKAPFLLDILVEDIFVVELKAVETILPLHEAQLVSYMRLARKPKGVLINFNTRNITRSAVHRVTELFQHYT